MRLYTSRGMAESLSNLTTSHSDITDITDAVEDSKTALELVERLNDLNLSRHFTLDRETEGYVRLGAVDHCGNRSYLRVSRDEMSAEDNQTYITGFSGTEVGDVHVEMIVGTKAEIENYFKAIVEDLEKEDPNGFVFDSFKEKPDGRFVGSIVFDHCHYVFSATPLKTVQAETKVLKEVK